MKILIINYEFPPLGGGAGNATRYLARELVTLGHDVLVLTAGYKNLAGQETLDGVKVVRVQSTRKNIHGSDPYEMLSFCWHAIRYVLKIKKQDWHFSSVISFFTIPSSIVAYIIKLRFKTPFITSLRGGDVPGFAPKELKYLHMITKPLIVYLWRRSQYVVANSNGLQRLAQQSIKQTVKDIKFIPNGVDHDIFKPNQTESISKLTILTVGRFRPQKNIQQLISSMPEILLHNKEAALTIVGDGPLRKQLENSVRELKLTNKIKFTGWLNQKELLFEYQQACILAMPSIDEGMSNVILEAMACGLPIVATPVSGNQELIDDKLTGYLVTDKKAMVTAVRQLLSDDALRTRMGKASLQKSRKFSWRKVAQQYNAWEK